MSELRENKRARSRPLATASLRGLAPAALRILSDLDFLGRRILPLGPGAVRDASRTWAPQPRHSSTCQRAEPLSSQDCFISTASVPRLSPWQFPHTGNLSHTARQPIRITIEIGQKSVPQRIVFHTNFYDTAPKKVRADCDRRYGRPARPLRRWTYRLMRALRLLVERVQRATTLPQHARALGVEQWFRLQRRSAAVAQDLDLEAAV